MPRELTLNRAKDYLKLAVLWIINCQKIHAVNAFLGRFRDLLEFSRQCISCTASFSRNLSIYQEDLFLGAYLNVSHLCFSVTAVCQTKVHPGTLSTLSSFIYYLQYYTNIAFKTLKSWQKQGASTRKLLSAVVDW